MTNGRPPAIDGSAATGGRLVNSLDQHELQAWTVLGGPGFGKP
jgi:hypothetical protein